MSSSELIALLQAPEKASRLAVADWNSVVEAGRKTQMLGQLSASLRSYGGVEAVPQAVQRHLDLADLTSKRRTESAMWEVATIRRAVDQSIPIILLKGCAYAACGDQNSFGRIYSDIDLMVQRAQLAATEAALFGAGWKPGSVSTYDAAYYRNWMHEVPPMEHVRRHTVVDLHHAINPPVSRHFVSPEKLLERIKEVLPGVYVLDAPDRVIHCALHMLQEGEPKKLLRDLYDLHLLVSQHFGGSDGVRHLYIRAQELQVENLVRVAVRAAKSLFASNDASDQVTFGWLRNCLLRAARDANGVGTMLGKIAGTAVLAHSHWMKMPVRLLVPHLVRKSYLRMTNADDVKSQAV